MTGHRTRTTVLCSALLLFPLILTQHTILGASQESRDPVEIVGTVTGSAGGLSSGAGIYANGTMAQPTPIGIASGDGLVLYSGFWRGTGSISGVDLPDQEPLRTALLGNYPNPFNPKTRIDFSLATEGPTELAIFNIRGELVRTLVNESLAAGPHTVYWDGTHSTGQSSAAGLYFYRLRAGEFESVQKMLLLK